MATTIREKAEDAVEAVLDTGQSRQIGELSVTKANLRDAHSILTEEESRTAVKSGRRPLFRNFNISGVS